MTKEREELLKYYVKLYRDTAKANDVGPIGIDDVIYWLEPYNFTKEEIDEALDNDWLH
jgi:hypothetical protein